MGQLIGKEKSRRDGLMVESSIKVGGKSSRDDLMFWTFKLFTIFVVELNFSILHVSDSLPHNYK